MTRTTVDSAASLESLIATTVDRLSRAIRDLSPREQVALYNVLPDDPPPPYFKVQAAVFDQPFERGSRHEWAWSAIAAGLAILGPMHDREADVSLWKVLSRSDYPNSKVDDLLSFEILEVATALPLVARFLMHRGGVVNWTEAALLVLSIDTDDHERYRERVTLDFHRG